MREEICGEGRKLKESKRVEGWNGWHCGGTVKGCVYFIALSKEKGKHINLNQIFQKMW